MKISHRLVALSAFSAAGLLCVAGVSYYAVTSIQSDLQGLTLRAAPLQTKTYEIQERTERLLGSLLKLSLAQSKDEAGKASSTIAADMQSIERLRREIRALDPQARLESADFRESQAEITRAVEKRLADHAAYRAETESARAALRKAEDAITATRTAVNQIGVEAGKAADKAQDAVRRLGNATKLALSAQARLKEVAIVVSEVDNASNRFRLGPLKEKVKSPLDSIQRLEVEAGSDDVLKEVRGVAAGMYDAFAKDGTGLLALRANVLANKPEAADAYQKQRKAIVGPLDEQGAKLGTLTDGLEVQAFKQRQALESALKLRNEPGGVVATSEEVSLAIRDMVGTLRLLMLSTNEQEAATAQAELKKQAGQLNTHMGTMRAGLLKMGRPQLAQQVDAALAAMTSVNGSVEKVAQAKRSLLASEAQMSASLAQLKTVAARQASLSEAQVKTVADRQNEVTAAVDRRVPSSLYIILGIAAGIIVATALLSWRTARLMSALGSMVGTLTGIVRDISDAAREISAGTAEISRGNQDLSSRTEQQASQLQTTASSVEELSSTVRQNADSASAANTLASQASEVRALAKKSADAAQQVKDIVTVSVGKVDAGSALVRDAGSTMQEIVTRVRRVTELISEIARASEEQAVAVFRLDAERSPGAARDPRRPTA